MKKSEYNKFLDAVDIVCINCCGKEENCKNCYVRRTCKMLEEKINEIKFEIEVGCEYTFETTDKDYMEYNGIKVKVVKALTDGKGAEYAAIFNDGNMYDVFEDELIK